MESPCSGSLLLRRAPLRVEDPKAETSGYKESTPGLVSYNQGQCNERLAPGVWARVIAKRRLAREVGEKKRRRRVASSQHWTGLEAAAAPWRKQQQPTTWCEALSSKISPSRARRAVLRLPTQKSNFSSFWAFVASKIPFRSVMANTSPFNISFLLENALIKKILRKTEKSFEPLVSEIFFCAEKFHVCYELPLFWFQVFILNCKRNRDQEWACFAFQTWKLTEALDLKFRQRTSHFVVSKICFRRTKHLQCFFVKWNICTFIQTTEKLFGLASKLFCFTRMFFCYELPLFRF